MVSYTEQRQERITVIYNSIKKSMDKGKEPDIEKLIYLGCKEWKCTRRTMMDYVKTVQNIIKYE